MARPLKVLVPLIQDEIKRGDDAGLEHNRLAGEMLVKAKEQLARGEWGRWLKRNFHLSGSTAQAYMRLARHTLIVDQDLTMSDVLRPHMEKAHKVAWHEPVRIAINRVNVERLSKRFG